MKIKHIYSGTFVILNHLKHNILHLDRDVQFVNLNMTYFLVIISIINTLTILVSKDAPNGLYYYADENNGMGADIVITGVVTFKFAGWIYELTYFLSQAASTKSIVFSIGMKHHTNILFSSFTSIVVTIVDFQIIP